MGRIIRRVRLAMHGMHNCNRCGRLTYCVTNDGHYWVCASGCGR